MVQMRAKCKAESAQEMSITEAVPLAAHDRAPVAGAVTPVECSSPSAARAALRFFWRVSPDPSVFLSVVTAAASVARIWVLTTTPALRRRAGVMDKMTTF